MYLLDTHTILRYFEGNENLSRSTCNAIDGGDPVSVSIASFWEIAIKKSLGRLFCSFSLNELESYCREAHFAILPITVEHLDFLSALAFIHHDPFD